MSHSDPTDPLMALVPHVQGAIAITSPSADECIKLFETNYPLGGSWKRIPHSEFDVKQRDSLNSLIAEIRELSAKHCTRIVLVVLDAFTDRVLQAPITSIEPLLHELVQLPCGCAVGPADGSWLADIRMVGSVYLGSKRLFQN